MKYYILEKTPGAEGRTTEWTSICHKKEDFLFIHHEPYRDLSRWTSVARGLPFRLYWKNWSEVSSHKTLTAAEKAAQNMIKEMEKESG